MTKIKAIVQIYNRHKETGSALWVTIGPIPEEPIEVILETITSYGGMWTIRPRNNPNLPFKIRGGLQIPESYFDILMEKPIDG